MKTYFNRLYNKTKSEFYSLIKENLKTDKRMFIVTANPETFMFGKKDSEVDKLLTDEKTTIVADGIGIVKAAGMLGIPIPERIPGVEVAEQIFVQGNELSKSVFLLGAKQEILDTLTKNLTEFFPKLKIVGAVNGYVEDKDAVFETAKKVNPDIILVALGIPQQEKLIYRHLDDFGKGIFVGVGGSFDVLSGVKARAPKFFINNNIEWLYRLLREPKRIKRFYQNNVKFFLQLRKNK